MRLTPSQIYILLKRLDLDDVYRWLHVLGILVVIIMTIIKRIAYILLCLSFGLENGLNNFCLISKFVIDLTNDILRDDTWDPDTIHLPYN